MVVAYCLPDITGGLPQVFHCCLDTLCSINLPHVGLAGKPRQIERFATKMVGVIEHNGKNTNRCALFTSTPSCVVSHRAFLNHSRKQPAVSSGQCQEPLP